jgi:hypothetical protein
MLKTTVICTPTARQRGGKKVPAKTILDKQSVARLHNNSNRRSVFNVVLAMPSTKQQNCKHVYDNRFLLRGPCRRFTGDSEVIAAKL